MLLSLALLACTSRPGGPATANGDPEHDWPALGAVDKRIVNVMNRDGIAGLAACAVVDGTVSWCGGYGERDTDAGLLATPETPFLLASVSKAVAAVGIMQAVEDGVLDLDADVNDVLPFAVHHPESPETPITGRHLMAHSAGIADNWDVMDAHYTVGDSDEPLGEFLEGYLAEGGADYSATENFLGAGVGTTAEYSNIGAALGAYLVEAATGTAFDEYSDTNLLAPLGMNAGWHLDDVDESEVALPTELIDGEFVTVPHFGFPDYPDGQLRADAYSMATFMAMIAQDGTFNGQTLLTAESVEALQTVVDAELDPTQGLTWYTWRLGGDDVWGHNGGEVGTSTEVLLRTRDNAGVVVLMNSEGTNDTLRDVELVILEDSGLW